MRRQESRDAEYRGAGIESQIKGSVASGGRNSTGASVCLLLLNFASDVSLFISVSLQDVVFPLTLRLHSKSVYSQNNGEPFFLTVFVQILTARLFCITSFSLRLASVSTEAVIALGSQHS